MTSINYDSELKRAGAHSTHGWRRLTFLAQRYILGTAGLFILLLFVWVAISADLIARYDPLSVDSAHRLAAPDWRRRPDDHLVYQLQFLARRLEGLAGDDDWRALAGFLDFHLLRSEEHTSELQSR